MNSPLSQRPLITLKLATSLDGRIATATGQSKWITGPQSRARVHHMRGEHDCVITGIGTILADDPELTSRTDPPAIRQPLRVVLDSNQRTPATSRLLATADLGKICLFHRAGLIQDERVDHHLDVSRYYVDAERHKSGGLDLTQVLNVLTRAFKVQTLMIEAGAKVAGAFLRADLVDKLVWFRAPILIGGDGLAVLATLGVEALNQALALERLSIDVCGDDLMETYTVKRKD